MLQTVRVSVGQTWRFVTADGRATVAWDKTGHRKRLDMLKGSTTSDPFQLPWPVYRSTLWEWFFNAPYDNVATPLLVAALLPLQYQSELDFNAPESVPRAPFEAVLHPFALSTVVHLNLFAVQPWPPEDQAMSLLTGFLKRALSPGGQVRDGIPLALLPPLPEPLPEKDFQGVPAQFQPAGRFVLLSGLHQQAPDPTVLAYRLASSFESTAAGRPMNTDKSGIAVTGRRVGLVLPQGSPEVGAKLRCLHQNMATLLAYMQNLTTLMPAMPTVPAAWFQGRAALVLNHLYRRAPLPEINGIYKSQLAELWIAHLGLGSAINLITANEANPPPPLP
ncbi:MAG: hypothetical protein M3144_03255 [Actinomycetota bacterium]|nr:hypothetical protein [Actinomycetota bacterium]